MDYEKIYKNLVVSAKERSIGMSVSKIKSTGYHELHHIIPKSMGGTDEKTNLVYLTAREHYIAHWILYKIHKNKQMTYAFFSMTKKGNRSQKRYNSHTFKYAKEAMAKMISQSRSGSMHPLFGKVGEESHSYGTKRSIEQRNRMSEAAKERYSHSEHPTSVRVVCIETGVVYESIVKAKLDHKVGNIGHALSTGGTAGGFHFSYAREDGSPVDVKIKENLYPKGSRNHMSKRVLEKTTECVFECTVEAAKKIGVTPSAVRWAIKNKKTIRGCEFIYV